VEGGEYFRREGGEAGGQFSDGGRDGSWRLTWRWFLAAGTTIGTTLAAACR